jgi:hypothetical protein
MEFDERIRELCDELSACRDDGQALGLARELKKLVHSRVEEIRERVAEVALAAGHQPVRKARRRMSLQTEKGHDRSTPESETKPPRKSQKIHPGGLEKGLYSRPRQVWRRIRP